VSTTRRLPWGELLVVECAHAFLVARVEDPADWLAAFEKNPAFPARNWAENMVRLYNARIVSPAAPPPVPPGRRPGSYHPDGV
jgi:hypothetical protein